MSGYRTFDIPERPWSYEPTDFSPARLAPGRKLTQAIIMNRATSDYKNKNIFVHVNGGSAESFAEFGRDNCAVLIEVGLLITYGRSINRQIADWTDGTNGSPNDFYNGAEFIMQQIGCARMTSSFNEAYGPDAPYALDMVSRPDLAIKFMRELAKAAKRRGWQYNGEYCGSVYPINQDRTFANSERYRPLLLNDELCYKSLIGQPADGQLNLRWLGEPTLASDIHLDKPVLIDTYFAPGAVNNQGPAFFLNAGLSFLLVDGTLRYLNNPNCRKVSYSFVGKKQTFNTQFYHKQVPMPVGGRFMGTDWTSWGAQSNFDLEVLSLIMCQEFEGWGAANVVCGGIPTIVDNDETNPDGVKVKGYFPDGAGNHQPGRAPTTFHVIDGTTPRGYFFAPSSTEDMPRIAADCHYRMYYHVGNSNYTFFQTRLVNPGETKTPWSKGTKEDFIDGFQSKRFVAVGHSDGQTRSAFQVFNFSKYDQIAEVMATGGLVCRVRIAAGTSEVVYAQA